MKQYRLRFAVIALAAAVMIGGCTDSSTPSGTSVSTPVSIDQTDTTAAEPQPGESQAGRPKTDGPTPRLFEVQLSEGELPELLATATAFTQGDALEEARQSELLGKLPKWDDPSTLGVPFAWPVQSSPPPRTGKTEVQPFPPTDTSDAPTVDNGPLKVLRVQPDGDVPIAPYLTVTFNQPMVAIGTVTQLTPADAPVKLDPAVPGRWQWIGTRTLRFDADNDAVDRLPMATKFTATVPAGTKSAAGGTLESAATFTFTTPTPTITSFGPQTQDMKLEPIFVAAFDQRIDQAAVLATITLNTETNVALRLATTAEIEADELAKNLVANAEDGRWIAFRPVSALSTDTAFNINIGPGTPSAEGPLKTESAQPYAGRTYGPLKVRQVSCTYGAECSPGTDFVVEFTNPLDPKAPGTTSAKIGVSPTLPVQKVTIDQVVLIEGATQPRTSYKITLPASLTDIYGQKLAKDGVVTISVGPASPSLQGLDLITTLDPFSSAQKLSVLTTNHDELRVRVFEADVAGFNAYIEYAQRRYDPDKKLPNWKVLTDNKIKPKGNKDTTIETLIDLGPALNGKPGQVIVLVEPVPVVSPNDERYYENQPILSWVQSTNMALDTFTDANEVRVWATDLRTGAPISGLNVAGSAGEGRTTNDEGLAVLGLNFGSINFVRATRGNESFILPVSAEESVSPDSLRWYAFDDRQIYRPGETMKVKGWVRQVDGATSALTLSGLKSAPYVVTDSYGVELTKGSVELGSLGGFDLSIEVPATANVGPANIQFLGGSSNGSSHSFQIAEFRRPEFEVKVTPVTATPFISTEPVTMATQASYFSGGPLPAAPVAWVVSTSETTYSPVGWDGFTFGIFVPWWWGERVFFERSFPNPRGPQDVKQYAGTTDGSGRHALQLDFTSKSGVLPDLPVSVSVAGTVTDVNRQAWADQQSILVHSANRYVGLRSDRTFVRQGDPLNIEAIVTNIDGKAEPGAKVTLTAGLLRGSYVNGEWVEEVVDPQTCSITSTAEPSKCEFKTPVGGQYRVSTTVADAKGGRNRTELSVWVSGSASQPARTVEQEALTVVPDKKQYSAGDTAKLLVQAPFVKGEGLMVVTHGNGVRETKRFTAADGSAQLEVAITEADVPNVSVTLEVVGASDRIGFDGKKVEGAPKRPAYAVGALTLSVPPLSRTLAVTATPADTELEPGGKTTIAVTVKDAKGAPVQGAEFAVVVVDEAVLGLTDYQLPDPIQIFYADGSQGVATRFGREQVRLVDPETLDGSAPQPGSEDAPTETAAAAAAAPLADAATEFEAAGKPAARQMARAKDSAAAGSSNPITVRSNFDALALFQPSVTTDPNGAATIDVTLPDNLTRYRVMVVAVSGNERFGTAESNITARLPLSVRPSAPRFLNTGDQFELPVVLQNLGKEPMEVDVVVQLANLDAVGPLGRRVKVPGNDRIEVRFPMKVRSAGTARLRVSGFATSTSDSAELAIPVYTPGTAEAFATYGTIDNGAIRQPLLAPTDVFDGYGGLEISTSSTSLQALTDALLYVNDYDYQSSDAYASRIMAISALRGVLKDFATEDLPSEAELNAAVERDIAGLVALQNDDGGWSYWRRYDPSQPVNTIEATHALVVAKQAGFAVSPNTLERALQYIANIEQYLEDTVYTQNYRDSARAYALWVRALAGQRDAGKAATLFSERGDKLNLDALAWIWGSLDDAEAKATVERTITNRAVDTAGAVSFTSGYDDSDYLILGSDRRTDAIVLDSLIANVPKSDLVEKVVAGLLANKTKGRWSNSQENTFALLAFKRYYDTYESVTPDFIAKAWVGNQFAGERNFKGRTTDRSQISIPMKALIEGGDRDLVVAKDGAGRLYYRIGLKYVPADLTLEALDRGFVIDRVYEGVDNKADVTRDPDGTWRIKAGAKVRVRLTLVAESQRTHVALIDPLPAGFEALNPALAVTQPVIDNEQAQAASKFWWWGNWYDHQQFRDDRSEAFTTFLPAGVYDYSYIARATTPGSFIVPPTRAEEMYAPETFGRAATDKVMIG